MTAQGRFLIGVSGWNYDGWRGDFYPKGLPRRRELEHVASRLTAVEVNGTFYSLQRRTTFERWASEVPDDFVFALKGSRYMTHLLRLVGVRTTAEAAVLAGEHDDRVPPEHALEVRHPSFADPGFAALLRDLDVAGVWSDAPKDWPVLDLPSSSIAYARLHGHTRLYASRYSDSSLDAWAQWCRRRSAEGRDVHVYFDNDSEGHAPHDAERLLHRLRPS